MDSLSLILDGMHFNGVVFTYTDMTAPWCWQLATPGLACFHIVTHGRAWLMREQEPPLLIEAGDLVVLPAGTPHQVKDKPQSLAAPIDLLPFMDLTETTPVRQQGGGTACKLISGHARFDIDMAAPLIAALPSIMVVRASANAPPLWLAARQLRSSALPLSKIAEQVGYSSEAAFSHAFKREHGEAPAIWRHKHQHAP